MAIAQQTRRRVLVDGHWRLRAGSLRRPSSLETSALTLGLLVLAVAFIPFIAVAVIARQRHEVFLGAAGFYPWDTPQYLSWVRDAHGGLARTTLGVIGARDFFSPMWSTSGWVQGATGVSDAAIVGFWKLAAAGVLLYGVFAVVREFVPGTQRLRQHVALWLGVWGGVTPFVALAIAWHLDDVPPPALHALGFWSLESSPALSLLDWTPQAMSIGLVCIAFVLVNRRLAARAPLASWWAPAVLGLIAGLLHPWQGEVLLIGTLIATALHTWPREPGHPHASTATALRRMPRGAVAVALAIAISLAYYAALGHWDPAWSTGQTLEQAHQTYPARILAAWFLPLLVVPLWMLHRRGRAPDLIVPIAWALAAAITLIVTPGNGRGIDGTSIPLFLLGVRAWPRLGRYLRWVPASALLVLAMMAAPFCALEYPKLHLGSSPTELLSQDEVAAIRLAGTAAAGRPILTTQAYGIWIEALGDGDAWVAHHYWTPNDDERNHLAVRLLDGRMGPAEAARLIAASGAGAVIQPCRYSAPIGPELAIVGLDHETRLGCVHVFSVGKLR